MKYWILSAMACAAIACGVATSHDQPMSSPDELTKKDALRPLDRPSLRQMIEGRGELEYIMTHDPHTDDIPRQRLFKAERYTQQVLAKKAAVSNILWEERGPNNVSGRTRSILIDSRDPTGMSIFAGGVGGGMWRSQDGGVSWQKIDDTYKNLAVSDIAQDPNNPNNIYFGTGEGYGNIDAIRGLGIWRSTDGGATFQHLLSTANTSFAYVNALVAVDAGNGQTWLISANRFTGVFISKDNGATWQQKLTGSGMDLTVSKDGDIYVGMRSEGIYKSLDHGDSWTQVHQVVSLEGRYELAAAPSDNHTIYALCEMTGSAQPPTIRKTTDGGVTWPLVSNPEWNDQRCTTISPDWTRRQDWYNLTVAVDPNNPNRAFIGGVDLFMTTDGGTTWAQASSWIGICGYSFSHADHHVLAFVPGRSDILYNGNDGGVYRSDNADAPVPDFTFRGIGLNITQFYAAETRPEAGSNYFLAGAQDNGTQKFTAEGLNNTSSATGGDGGFCHIDQANPLIQITAFTGNNYSISIDGGNTFGNGPRLNTGQFINPTDYDDETQKLYGGNSTSKYFRWENPSTGGNDFTNVSATGLAGSITHVKVSPNVSDLVYFGTNAGRVYKVAEASTGTVRPAIEIFASNGTISCVEVEVGNEDHMLITQSNYGVVSVYESTNATAAIPSWTEIEGNLPDMPVRWVIFHPGDGDQAFLATELGVWSTDDIDGPSTDWGPTNANLANTRIDMIKYRASDQLLYAASHGRGLFTSNSLNREVTFSKTAASSARELDTIEYTLTIKNNTDQTITDILVSDVVDTALLLIPSSLSCGTLRGNTITINLPSLGAFASQVCTFEAIINAGNSSGTYFSDDLESGVSNWSVSNDRGAATWSLTTAQSSSPAHAWFSPNSGVENTQRIILSHTLSQSSILSFWHFYNTEAGWDGGFVEISTDGGQQWIDLGGQFIQNGYNGLLAADGSNPDIAGHNAFTGGSGGFIHSLVDLSDYADQSAQIRFTFGEDSNTLLEGWYIDDIQLVESYEIPNVACLNYQGGTEICSSTSTYVEQCESNCRSCDDGIKNGSETGIDCGGAACSPCPCTDEEVVTIENTTVDSGLTIRTIEDIVLGDNVSIGTTHGIMLQSYKQISFGNNIEIQQGTKIEMISEVCQEQAADPGQ